MKALILIITTFLTSLLEGTSSPISTIDTVNESDSDVVVGSQIIENTNFNNEIYLVKEIIPTTSASEWWKYPSVIKTATRDGDDLLVLVNKEYKLPSTYAPSDLVLASLSGIRKGSSFYIRNIVINDLTNMVDAAEEAEIDLSIVSGYRSYTTQFSTYNYWLSINGGIEDEADKISARAGHSQHQLGTVIDFSSSEINDGLSGKFSTTKASIWLAENAWRYGFVISFPSGYEDITGYSYESWHYRYIGVANAKEMRTSGMILELYLESKD